MVTYESRRIITHSNATEQILQRHLESLFNNTKAQSLREITTQERDYVTDTWQMDSKELRSWWLTRQSKYKTEHASKPKPNDLKVKSQKPAKIFVLSDDDDTTDSVNAPSPPYKRRKKHHIAPVIKKKVVGSIKEPVKEIEEEEEESNENVFPLALARRSSFPPSPFLTNDNPALTLPVLSASNSLGLLDLIPFVVERNYTATDSFNIASTTYFSDRGMSEASEWVNEITELTPMLSEQEFKGRGEQELEVGVYYLSPNPYHVRRISVNEAEDVSFFCPYSFSFGDWKRVMDYRCPQIDFYYSHARDSFVFWTSHENRYYRVSLPLASIFLVKALTTPFNTVTLEFYLYPRAPTSLFQSTRLPSDILGTALPSFLSLPPMNDGEDNRFTFETSHMSPSALEGKWYATSRDWTEGGAATLNDLWTVELGDAENALVLLREIGQVEVRRDGMGAVAFEGRIEYGGIPMMEIESMERERSVIPVNDDDDKREEEKEGEEGLPELCYLYSPSTSDDSRIPSPTVLQEHILYSGKV